MFSNGAWNVKVKTVGEAIRELSLLPLETRMDQDNDGEGSDLVLMNRETSPFLYVDAGGNWSDDPDVLKQ